MICKKCNTDFDVNTYGTRCPNCDTDNPLQTFDNAADATKYIIDLYGKEILKNGKKFFGIVNDIMPRLVKEKNMFLHMYKENIFFILYNVDGKKDSDKKLAMFTSVKKLIDNVGFSEQTSVDAVEYITSALNWSIKLDANSLKNSNASTVVTNISPASTPVNNTKLSMKKFSKKKVAICIVSAVLSIGLLGVAVSNTMKKKLHYAASDEYMGEDEQLFEEEYNEEYSEKEKNEEIVYSNGKTYKNSYSETEKKVSSFEEELTISTKDKKTKFSNGVEFSLISNNSDNDDLRLVYEVYNPTDYPVDFDCHGGSIVYNKNNEITARTISIYEIAGEGYGDIIFPRSRMLFEVNEDYDWINVTPSELDRIETKIRVKSVNVKAAKNITVSDIEFSGNDVNYKIKTGEIKDKDVSWQISFFDGKGNVVALSCEYCAELFSNTTELFESNLIFSGNNNPIEKIVFNAYYD